MPLSSTLAAHSHAFDWRAVDVISQEDKELLRVGRRSIVHAGRESGVALRTQVFYQMGMSSLLKNLIVQPSVLPQSLGAVKVHDGADRRKLAR